jgi:hypothetical protein
MSELDDYLRQLKYDELKKHFKYINMKPDKIIASEVSKQSFTT